MDIEELVVEHAGWIRKTATRFYSDDFDADDLASETICKILSNAGKYNPERSFKPWALTIMENIYKTQYTRRRCVVFTGFDGYDCFRDSDFADQQAIVSRILSIIRECGRKSRNIESVLLYSKGFCYDEIAHILGIPIGTVKSRVALGRKMLREALE